MKMLFWIAALVALSACGKQSTQEVRFFTTEVPGTETDEPWDGEGADTLAVASAASGALSNTLAGLVQKVLPSSGTDLSPTILGHALPAGARLFDLTGCREKTKTYEKRMTSLIGANLITLEYRVAYLYGCRHRTPGTYLGNVRFTPLRVRTDPLWSLTASAVSQTPVNAGTAASPVARLGFAITFSAGGVGSQVTTDEFTVEASNGNLTEEIRRF